MSSADKREEGEMRNIQRNTGRQGLHDGVVSAVGDEPAQCLMIRRISVCSYSSVIIKIRAIIPDDGE